MISAEQQKQKLFQCTRVFNPSAPVNQLKLFAGRIDQVENISQAVSTRGRHAILYGDRGVGKTSLVNILRDLFASISGLQIVKINCVETDNFENVWRKALSQIVIVRELYVKNDPHHTPIELSLDEHLARYRHIGPGEIRQVLEQASSDDFEIVIVFDEFDKLPDAERHIFADTIKDLSDNSICVTLVLVGIARDVSELLEEHASIDRCLIQILMPLMKPDELQDIIQRALTTLEMSIPDAALGLIVSLSQGLPHYTHLLGQEAAIAAIKAGRLNILDEDVRKAISESLVKTQYSIITDYLKATQGQRKGTLFPQVLLACALAKVDELGFFTSADIRTPLRQLTGQDYDIPNYAQHLEKFSSDESRGPALEKWGSHRRFKYRFRNPLIKPYVIMKALQDGSLANDLLSHIQQ